MGSRAHFNTMCFLFAGKIMEADANQLQELRKFLRAGDEDSARIEVNRQFKSIVSRE